MIHSSELLQCEGMSRRDDRQDEVWIRLVLRMNVAGVKNVRLCQPLRLLASVAPVWPTWPCCGADVVGAHSSYYDESCSMDPFSQFVVVNECICIVSTAHAYLPRCPWFVAPHETRRGSVLREFSMSTRIKLRCQRVSLRSRCEKSSL